MELIKNLNWRYATKQFDPTKKISQDQLLQLQEAIRLSASSYGLQAYKVIIVKDKETKEQLLPACFNQQQIVDSSEVFVFCNYVHVNDDHIDAYVKAISEIRNIPNENLSGFGDYMKTTIGQFTDDQVNVWTAKQTYIALGNLLAAAGELKIDSCPMEGFDSQKVNEILDLSSKNLNAAVICPVGYRSNKDQNASLAKVRKTTEELFTVI